MPARRQSCYFFDFDKNIMSVKVPMVLTNTTNGDRKEMASSDYMAIRDQLGKEGPWKDWSDTDLFLNYRDLPDVAPEEQSFVKQIRSAVESGNTHWQGPAWGAFVYACQHQRPFSMISARGHSDETVKAGLQVLKEKGLIEQTPNYLTLYNVSYPPTRSALGDPGGKVEVDALKRIAIERTVEAAIEKYGHVGHHFGMSDDTMENVDAAANALVACKLKYPKMRFFIIATNAQYLWKAELFPADFSVGSLRQSTSPPAATKP